MISFHRMAALGVGLLLLGCSDPESPRTVPPKAVIVSPQPGQTVWEGDWITLLAQGKGSCQWRAKGLGTLASTASASVRLPFGTHTLTLHQTGKHDAEVSVTVRSAELGPGMERRQVVHTGTPWVRPFGKVRGLMVNFGPTALWNAQTPGTASSLRAGRIRPEARLTAPGLSGRKRPGDRRALIQPHPVPGDRLGFDLVDLSGAGYRTVKFELVAVTKNLEFWLDGSATPDSRAAVTPSWTERVEDMVAGRLLARWGLPPDIDDNGRIRILLTPSLNESRLAVGYFNPSDLYPGEEGGNEGEYLYLGVPSATDPFYPLASLAATVAHEGFHLIHYGTRVFSPWLATGRVYPEETVEVSEGLAHLSEVLAGYGVSGGNVVFAAHYLEAPEETSFTGADLDGVADTAAKRGGWSLFLSWLASEHPLGEDIFGLLIRPSARIGWDRLSEVLGGPADAWLLRWAEALQRNTQPTVTTDPVTGEPLYLTGWEGDIEWTPGQWVSLRGPRQHPFDAEIHLPSRAIVFWEPEVWNEALAIEESRLLGQGYVTLSWVGY